jgi:hypothetical protein
MQEACFLGGSRNGSDCPSRGEARLVQVTGSEKRACLSEAQCQIEHPSVRLPTITT